MKKDFFTTYKGCIVSFIIILALIVSSSIDGIITAQSMRDKCLRLHVLANSDDNSDQELKLCVRDALLEKSAGLFNNNKSSEDAVKTILENKQLLIDTANKVIRDRGFDYSADIEITDEYFETRQYDNIMLPAGTYKACKVILGKGEGHNWWCVMFPPLCLPAVTEKEKSDEIYAVFGDEAAQLITKHKGFKLKLKIVEIIEELAEKIRTRNDNG